MNKVEIREIVERLEALLPIERGPHVLHEPELTAADKVAVAAAIDEGYVSAVGRQVVEFEQALAARCGAAHVVAAVNGTTALHAALLALGIRPDDEVICPSLTFVATANSISHCGAVPHFVDSDAETLGLDPDALSKRLSEVTIVRGGELRNKQTGRRIAAIVAVHVFGHPCQIAGLQAIARDYGIPLIEDAAESLGSKDRNGPLGGRGAAGVLSFNGNKIVTTGGGGAILTNDATMAARVKHLTTTAKRAHDWQFFHDEIGFNYRMPNLNAALGLAQLARLDDFVTRKRALADIYINAFADALYWRPLREPDGSESNYWLNAVVLVRPDMALLEDALQALAARRIHCRPCWTPMHELPMYAAHPRGPLPVCNDLTRRILCLPSSPKLADMIALRTAAE